MEKAELEEGRTFSPRFDKDGLIPCITTSHRTGTVLMFAYMNKESLKCKDFENENIITIY